MTVAASLPASRADLRRLYRRELQEAIEMGASDTAIRHVLTAFRGQHPDPDELRYALQQYVDPGMLADLETERAHKRKTRPGACPVCLFVTTPACGRVECPGGGSWPACVSNPASDSEET